MTETNCICQYQRQIFPDLAKPKLLVVGTKLHALALGPFSWNVPTFSSNGIRITGFKLPVKYLKICKITSKEFSVK